MELNEYSSKIGLCACISRSCPHMLTKRITANNIARQWDISLMKCRDTIHKGVYSLITCKYIYCIGLDHQFYDWAFWHTYVLEWLLWYSLSKRWHFSWEMTITWYQCTKPLNNIIFWECQWMPDCLHSPTKFVTFICYWFLSQYCYSGFVCKFAGYETKSTVTAEWKELELVDTFCHHCANPDMGWSTVLKKWENLTWIQLYSKVLLNKL